MPKPVYLMTVQEAHKEYSSLTDQIRAKYEQLDSGKFGSPGTPAFDAEACELANLLARVSQLCIKTEPADSKGIIQVHILQALKTLFGSKLHYAGSLGYGGLLSAPLDLRIGDWLCILPAITLVVVQSKKVKKAASSD